MARPEIVISGAGLISPLGLSREATFAAVLEGRCGIGRLSAMESALPEGRDGGEALELPEDFEPALPREARYLRRAIWDAMVDAGLAGGLGYAPERCGLMIGTTLHGMRAAGRFLRNDDFRELGKFLATHVVKQAAGDLGIGGFAATTCSACSSSLGSVALGVTMLESGPFDLVIAGGYDPVSEYAYAGFNALRLVAEGALRPFAKGRVGMKLSEGYGIVILERAEDARRRGATALARVAGFGESADAHHLTQPHPQGEGAARAMRAALESAGVGPQEIGLLVAHATGTPDNDASEFAAMSRVFGENLARIPCVAFKSHLGHTLGGAGAVEMILAAMAMQKQMVPPCANVKAEDVEFAGLNLATGEARSARIGATLSTSLGFGGANTCVVLKPAKAISAPAVMSNGSAGEEVVVISGVGVILPGGVGNEAFLQVLGGDRPGMLGAGTTIAEEAYAHLVNARRIRRMSDYVKLLLAATSVAMSDAQVADVGAFAEGCSAILGTTHGSCGYSEQYYRQVVKEGVLFGNPMLFAEGVPNAGSAHVSLMLGLKGACQTIIGSRTAGLEALALATWRVRSGRWSRAVVGAAEEWSPLTAQAYAACGLGRETAGAMAFEQASGFASSAGAVVMILESRKSAEARGASARAVVREVASRVGHRGDRIANVAAALAAVGCPQAVVSSANATWVDGAEAAGIARAVNGSGVAKVTSVYGHAAEMFSVGPLAGVAGTLLAGRLPKLWGEGKLEKVAAADGEKVDDFGVICTDFTGMTAAARIGLLPSRGGR